MESLYPELKKRIVFYTKPSDKLSLSQVNKFFYGICESENNWEIAINMKDTFSITRNIRAWKTYYCVEQISELGYLPLLKLYINLEFPVSTRSLPVYALNLGLVGACRSGDTDTINYMRNMNDPIYWDQGLHTAYQSGLMSAANIMINHLRDNNIKIDWESGFKYACRGGDQDIINMTIKHLRSPSSLWKLVLPETCESGNLNLVTNAIKHGANNWDQGLYRACIGGHLNVAGLMVSKGANNFNNSLYAACISKKMNIVNFLLEKGANEFEKAFCGAAIGGNIAIIELIDKKRSQQFSKRNLIDSKKKSINYQIYHQGFSAACVGGNFNAINWFIQKCLDNGGKVNWNKGLTGACMGQKNNVMKFAVQQGAAKCDCGATILQHF